MDGYKDGDFYNTHKMGSIVDIGYKDMVKILGEPNADDDGYKVDASWRFIKDNGDEGSFAIWNFKDGPNYNGKGTTMDDIREWSFWYSAVYVLDELEDVFGDCVRAWDR